MPDDPSRLPDSPGPHPSRPPGGAGSQTPVRRYTTEEIVERALIALGSITVEMFQEGGGPGGELPDFDWMVLRNGGIVGYGWLAERFDRALRAELEDCPFTEEPE